MQIFDLKSEAAIGRFGNAWYAETMADNGQIWAQVRGRAVDRVLGSATARRKSGAAAE